MKKQLLTLTITTLLTTSSFALDLEPLSCKKIKERQNEYGKSPLTSLILNYEGDKQAMFSKMIFKDHYDAFAKNQDGKTISRIYDLTVDENGSVTYYTEIQKRGSIRTGKQFIFDFLTNDEVKLTVFSPTKRIGYGSKAKTIFNTPFNILKDNEGEYNSIVFKIDQERKQQIEDFKCR